MVANENDCGWVKLGYAIVEQAVEDLKALQGAEIIKDGQAIERWPERAGRSAMMYGYSKAHQAKELLLWFRNGAAEEMLAMLQAPISIDAIRQRLHI